MFLLSNYALYLSLYGENDESKQKEAVFVKNNNNKEMKTCSERQKGQSDKDGQRRSDVMMITRRTGHSWRIKKLIGTCSDVTRRTILSNIPVSIHGLYFTNFWSFQTAVRGTANYRYSIVGQDLSTQPLWLITDDFVSFSKIYFKLQSALAQLRKRLLQL